MATSFTPQKKYTEWNMRWHEGWVTSVSFLGSSNKLAAGNILGKISVWDELPAEPPEAKPDRRGRIPKGPTNAIIPPSRLLEGHTNLVPKLTATADGRWLVSACYDHTVRIWDMNQKPDSAKNGEVFLERKANSRAPDVKPVTVPTQPAAKILTGHQEWVRSLSPAGDGTKVFTGDDAGVAILWEIPSGKELARVTTKAGLQGVGLSHDAKLAVTCEDRKGERQGDPSRGHRAVLLWDLASGKVVHDLTERFSADKKKKDTPKIREAAFSPDNRLLALAVGGPVGNGHAKIFLFDAQSGKLVRELEGQKHGVRTITFSPDGKYLIVAAHYNVAAIWTVADGKQFCQLGASPSSQYGPQVYDCSLAPDGRRIAGAATDGRVRIWEFAKK